MRDLRVFLDVAKLRSISLAATAHGITQSAVSQRIHQLETDLGVKLFDRSVRPLALTAAGRLFASEARELVDGYERLWKKVGKLGEQPSGSVRVDAIYSAGIDLLQALRESFEAANPEVQVLLDYKRPEQVEAAVGEGTCDLGIVSYPKRRPGLAVKPLRDERMIVVCPPDHPLLIHDVIDATKLRNLPLVGFGSDLPAGRQVRKYLRSCGVNPSFTYEPDNIDTMKSMIAVGGQIAILPRRTVAREVAAGTLGAIDLEPPLHRPIGIIYRRGPSLGAAALAFIAFLLENADPDAIPISKPARVRVAS